MTTPNTPPSFGQHFTCECCGLKMTSSSTGLKHKRLNAFIQPLAVDEGEWKQQYDELIASGIYEPATLCGHCGYE